MPARSIARNGTQARALRRSADVDAYGADPSGAWLNRIHTFEVTPENAPAQIVHFPKSCLHCDDAPCVTVCPTGASHKRSEDGIVLVTEDMCIGCGLCAWACPYGAREMDPVENVMKKCTLCVDRIYSDTLPEEDRIPACVRPARQTHGISAISTILDRTCLCWSPSAAASI
jgi:Fe-S-cluster-containing dehydrogenase component